MTPLKQAHTQLQAAYDHEAKALFTHEIDSPVHIYSRGYLQGLYVALLTLEIVELEARIGKGQPVHSTMDDN